MSRADLERQLDLQYKGKTPEEMIQIGRQIALDSMAEEKRQGVAKVQALRSLFNLGNPRSDHIFKR